MSAIVIDNNATYSEFAKTDLSEFANFSAEFIKHSIVLLVDELNLELCYFGTFLNCVTCFNGEVWTE